MRWWVFVLSLASASPSHADNARLVAAWQAYDGLEHQQAIQLLAQALAGALPLHERAEALRLEGCAHMVLGNKDAAIAAFRASFRFEPDAGLEPKLAQSPDARALFEIARGLWRADLIPEMDKRAADIARIRLDVRAPATAPGGRPLAIEIGLQDPAKLVARVELSYKRRGQAAFTLLTRDPAPAIAFEVPAEVTETARQFALEYHVTLRHESGFDLRRAGDADHPRVVEVLPGHRPRWYQHWWARGVIAAGVVGIAAGGYLFYRSIDVGGQHAVVP